MISSSRSGRQVVIGPAPRGFARSFPMRSGAPPRACPSRAVPGGGRGAGGVQPVETKNCGRSRRREGHGRGRMSCDGGDGGRPRRFGEAEGDQATRRQLPGRRRPRGRGVHAAEAAGGRVRRSTWGGRNEAAASARSPRLAGRSHRWLGGGSKPLRLPYLEIPANVDGAGAPRWQPLMAARRRGWSGMVPRRTPGVPIRPPEPQMA